MIMYQKIIIQIFSNSTNNQYNYIAEMSNPWTVSSDRVLMAENAKLMWERSENLRQ